MKNIFKTFVCVILGVILMLSAVACINQGGENPAPNNYFRPSNANIDDSFVPTSKILVAYFSKTNTTKGVAEKIQQLTNADIFEIERKEPYPNEYTPTTQVAQDEKEANARPELSTYLPDEVIAQYDTIILGFPIWWHTAPMPVLSFLNYYELSGKTIYTFCTSGGSGISESTADVRNNAKGADVVEGRRFSSGSDNSINGWLDGLGLMAKAPVTPENPDNSGNESTNPEQPETPVEIIASLTYERNGNAYTVTGAGEGNIIVIPAEYDGYPVTTIGESAFAYSRHNDDIISVTIPDSITTIERNAFYNRDELAIVNIGANSRLQTIGNNAFSGNHSLKSIYIPASVTNIGDSAFNNCGGLDTITVAENNAIYSSEGNALIEKVSNTLIRGTNNTQISSSVTTIAPSAFRRTTTMTTLTIPATVTKIGNYFIADSSIKIIDYKGTEDSWNAIEKSASMWNYGNRDVELNFKSQSKVLVVYFSATNNTERVAQYIANATGGEIFELLPVNAYTSTDLNYSNQSSRVYQEHLNEDLQNVELQSTNVENWEDYDTVFIGYPIWWGIAAWPVNNFVKNNNFAGKTVVPFATAVSSGIGQSGELLEAMTNTGDWQIGRCFHSYEYNETTITNWVNGLNLVA